MKGFTLLLAIAGGCAASAHADCDQPPLVVIPAEEEILEAREAEINEATREYFQAMQEYVTCIREELEAAGDDASELFVAVLVQRNNSAVAEAEAVQRWYNGRFPSDANGFDEDTNQPDGIE